MSKLVAVGITMQISICIVQIHNKIKALNNLILIQILEKEL